MRRPPEKDLYSILGVTPDFTAEEIRDSYLARTRVIHPDRFDRQRQPQDWKKANEMLAELNEAYSILRNPSTRAQYNDLRPGKRQQQSSPPPHRTQRAPEPPPRQAGKETTVELPGGVNLGLCWVPPGAFRMGSPSSEKGRYGGEDPQHRVTISNGFYMCKYEVTQAQWKSVMGSNPSHFKGDCLPVENVSWNDVQDFINKLNARTGKHFRLPTEAEWEYACRGGTDTAYCFGDGTGQLPQYAWYIENSGQQTHPVGQKEPNAFGLFDMHGNVWEWCSDWYDGYPSDSVTDPTGPASGVYRVLRGGGWIYSAQFCRSAYRNWDDPSNRSNHRGFRLARDEKEQTARSAGC